MQPNSVDPVHQQIEAIYRDQSRRVFATLAKLLRDFDLAEEALQESFAAAVVQWKSEGIPANPLAWLVSTGRFKAIDLLRRRGRLDQLSENLVQYRESIDSRNSAKAAEEIEDDRLRLIFTCCHPAIDPKVQVPLTLREVCGLTTEEIANAFLTSPTTMAQRIVRGKAKIRDARIPIDIPSVEDFPERLQTVLAVIYLVFNEGYSASFGNSVTRADLSAEAIRLGRLLVQLLPDAEAIGLLALMLLHESRRVARSDQAGDIVLLEDQDRSQWDRKLIDEGLALVEQSLLTRHFGAYTLQAAISSVHARSQRAAETDWQEIVRLYDALQAIHPSPVVELNRAVAIAMRDGPGVGLVLIDEIVGRGDLQNYYLAHAAKADMLRRMSRLSEAKRAYQSALELAQQEPEIRFLRKRIAEMDRGLA